MLPPSLREIRTRKASKQEMNPCSIIRSIDRDIIPIAKTKPLRRNRPRNKEDNEDPRGREMVKKEIRNWGRLKPGKHRQHRLRRYLVLTTKVKNPQKRNNNRSWQ